MQWGGECWSSGVSPPSFESQLGYLVALELWGGNLSFQSLSFVIYKMQMIMVTMSSDDAGKVLSEMLGRYLDAKVNAIYHYCYYYYYYYCLVGVQRGNT